MKGIIIGIDTYSFHRLLGDARPGEQPPGSSLSDGGIAALELAASFGPDLVALQTCFLDPELDPVRLRTAAAEIELALSWGHPEGLAFGTRPEAEVSLARWLRFAATAEIELVRIVVGGPRLRGVEPVEAQLARTVEPLRRCAAQAAGLGLRIAIENHGDLTLAELSRLLEMVGDPVFGICLDTANVVRLGEDLLAACGSAAPQVRMVHLKDTAGVGADPVAGPVSVPYGSGAVPLAGVLEALGDVAGAEVPICVEIGQVRPGDDELELVASGVEWLNRRRLEGR